MDELYRQKVNAVNRAGGLRLTEILSELNIVPTCHKSYYTFACPIHSGDNRNALQIYAETTDTPGRYRCVTHHCEQEYGNNLIGFIRGVLSSTRSHKVTHWEAVKWLCDFLGLKFSNLQINEDDENKLDFINQNRPESTKVESSGRITREQIRNRLVIPADFFINRGFKPNILDEYDVGLCTTKGKPAYNRVVVPVYDENHKYMVGYTARSIYAECPNCKLYHSSSMPCPTNNYELLTSTKWLHSKDFQTNDHLFNIWRAKKYIKKNKTAILVEGPMDAIRLSSAKLYALALFGTSLKRGQLNLLEQLGVMNLIVLLDNDIAGRKGCETIQKQCGKMFNCYYPNYNAEDPGQLSGDSLNGCVNPILDLLRKIRI